MRKFPALLFLPSLFFLLTACVAPTREPARPRVTLSPSFRPDLYNRLAVIVFDQTGRFHRSGALREVEDEFIRAVIERGYTLAARSDVDKILQELKFQRSGLTENDAAQIGRLLNVPAVILVSINCAAVERYQPIVYQRDQQYYMVTASISARLISAERGEVLWLSSYTGSASVTGHRSDRDAEMLAPVARVVATGFPQKY